MPRVSYLVLRHEAISPSSILLKDWFDCDSIGLNRAKVHLGVHTCSGRYID